MAVMSQRDSDGDVGPADSSEERWLNRLSNAILPMIMHGILRPQVFYVRLPRVLDLATLMTEQR